MNIRKFQIMLAISALVLATLACNFGASTANIKNAWTAQDEEGNQPTTVFAQDEIFYLVVDLANAPGDTVVKATWTAVDVEGEAPNTALDENEVTSGDDTLYFNLTNDQLWPVGKYKVDIYLNDKLDRTLDFEVQGTVSPDPTAEPTTEPAVSGEASLENAVMSRDDSGTELTSVFGPNDVFYCIVDLVNASDDTTVKASWTAVDVQGENPDTFIDEAEITQGSGTITFNLTNSNPWPVGKYKVDLYLNGNLDQTLEFEVQ
jgi:hypothetical protein